MEMEVWPLASDTTITINKHINNQQQLANQVKVGTNDGRACGVRA